MTDTAVFSPRLLAGWMAAAALTLALSLYLMGSGSTETGTDRTGPTTFSTSALGYAGIAETLHRLDLPVLKSRYASQAKLGRGGVLVLAEPRPIANASLAVPLLQARNVLLILPKWSGEPSERRPAWIGRADLIGATEADWALNLVSRGSRVTVAETAGSWTTNKLDTVPSLTAPVQLIQSERLTPLVASEAGMLVGEYRDRTRRVWILSDPDVLNNLGLGAGDNAAFAVALIKALRSGDGTIVFDETIHGYLNSPASPLALLFRFPFIVVTLQAVLAIGLLLWATTGRFGTPDDAPPPLTAGKQGLVQNAARLLDVTGHQRIMVRRYCHAALRTVAQKLHAPRELSDWARLEWLQRTAGNRAIGIDCTALFRRIDETAPAKNETPAELLAIAQDIHRWKGEMSDGPSGHQRNH